MSQKPPRRPLTMVMGNLVAATALDDVWAIYRIRCRSYRAEPRRRQEEIASELAAYARQAEADFQILRVTRRWNADEYTRRLQAAMPARAHERQWRAYLETQRQALEGVDPWQPSTFLAVRLADPARDLQARAARLFDQSLRERWGQFKERTSIRHQGSLNVAAVTERANVAQLRVESNLDARPATPEEMQWLIRRAATRGLGDPVIAPVEPSSTPYEEATRSMVRWLAEGGFTRQHRYLIAHSELGDSYQAALCLGEMGHATPFSRQCELMFSVLEEHDFPADACLNVRWVSNDQALRKAAHQLGRTHHQLADEAASAVGAHDDGYRRAELARELHSELDYSGDPLLLGSLSLLLGADSREEMERQVSALRRSLPWDWYRPHGEMVEAFQQHWPGQRSLVANFERPFTCEQVGAMVPHGTHEAGSDTPRAMYIGKTLDGGQPVLFDLREASMSDQAPTIALLGTLGSGKTMTLQMLMHQAYLQGARIVDIDPKGDHRFHLLPQVAPHTQVIHLGPQGEHAGKLDPLRIAPANERHDATATFLLDVLPTVDAAIHAAISGAITRTMDRYGERACCWEVVNDLRESVDPDELKAGSMLAQFAEAGLARLGFARLDDPLPTLAASQVTYLQIRALKRAAVNTVRSEMSQSQRHGRAVLQLVALYAMKILGDERDRLKVLSFDEASFLAQDAVGQQLLDTLARWGRSELAVPILSTQLLGDVSAQENLVGQTLAFAMRSREHARQCLESIELDGDGPLAKALTSRYKAGMCLYRDLRGRCEEVQIHFADPALLDALQTTPAEDAMPLRSVV